MFILYLPQGVDSPSIEIELIGINHQTFTRREEETEKKDDLRAVRMKQPTLFWPPKTRAEEGKREDETEKNGMEEIRKYSASQTGLGTCNYLFLARPVWQVK